MKILNVAEKPSAAAEISTILSGSRKRQRDGFSRFNCVWDFNCNILGTTGADMVFTSVLGHLMSTDMEPPYNNWNYCDPIDLFEAPIYKLVDGDNNPNIFKTLQREARQCDHLILWLDCDREGENIAFEVLECVKQVKSNIRVHRAHFSSIIPTAIKRAIETLTPPNQKDSLAVDCRIEIDLRLGAVFTRFQSTYLRSRFDIDSQVISYGPCQFPTLGFVVERFLRIENFVPEDYWSIGVTHNRMSDGEMRSASFGWKRNRLFEHAAAFVLYEKCLDSPVATVVDVNIRENRYRPVPLTTIELQKMASKKLRISSDQTMKLAEELYNKGLISYPRTETDAFVPDTDFMGLISLQTNDQQWGQYARSLVNGEFVMPKEGRNNDNSHPPIHPTNHAGGLTGNAKALYEFITRRFLACCSRESVYGQTTVTIDIAGERFSDSGSMLLQKGYLEVYPYDKRGDRVIPTYTLGETFPPNSIDLNKSRTVAPKPLSEPELLSAMDNNKIGTDATMAQHIKKILDREYVVKNEEHRFIPTNLGKALIQGYDSMGFEFSKPTLRAKIEADVQKISTGTMNKEQVLKNTIDQYRILFVQARTQTKMLDIAFNKYFRSYGHQFKTITKTFTKCGKCENPMEIKLSNNNNGELSVNATRCPLCQFQVVSVTNETGYVYTMCPYCRNNPPSFFNEPSKPFHCFQCTAQCTLARGHTYKPAAKQLPAPSANKYKAQAKPAAGYNKRPASAINDW
ncbi:hypothetical protein SAMD00019534_112170 [Acytostelium subglobosum LB1]|uniref:hypothetical protein n=1 Tax=Acytostelium subglobosum LB1 TaxID=1410327 RepID=UPI000645123D|nr:hypothetical protein SAMD00019534_112170 [Acytostelium subglobosum LB1]GAM28041.1 hypothetical protein SAMD00019534_112170 [Acytostelium subglobosum LB1]|eukprot:XP_012749000.1 hypothetical protein SAMD00019534_112170 [Acytostelium subglobosum LB1]